MRFPEYIKRKNATAKGVQRLFRVSIDQQQYDQLVEKCRAAGIELARSATDPCQIIGFWWVENTTTTEAIADIRGFFEVFGSMAA